MGRTPEGGLALTGAERQARYRARIGQAQGPVAAADAKRPRRRSVSHRAVQACHGVGMKRSPVWPGFRRNTHGGLTHCRKPHATARPARLYKSWPISTSRKSWPYGRPAALDETRRGHRDDKRTGPYDTLPARPVLPRGMPRDRTRTKRTDHELHKPDRLTS